MSTTRAIVESLTSNENSALLAFWRESLANLNIMQLQPDYPRIVSYEKGTLAFEFNKAAMLALKQIFHHEDCSLLILTALIVVLHQYTQETDLCVGYGANALPIRIQFHPNIPFNELLTQLKIQIQSAKSHELPNSIILKNVLTTDNLSRLPNGLPFSVIYQPEMDEGNPSTFTQNTYFTIGCQFTPNQKSACAITYNAAMFSKKRIERLSDHLNHCLKAVALIHTTPICRISLITDEELMLLNNYNQPLSSIPLPRKTLGNILEETASSHPNNIAISFHSEGDPTPQELTYETLNAYASKFSNFLNTRGLAPNTPIAICLPRSLIYYPILFGCVKSSHPFTPLETSTAQLKLIKYKLDALNAPIIVNNTTEPLFSEWPELTLINLDDPEISNTIKHQDVTYPCPPADPEKPMYYIFSSGTTGNPKGISIPHRGPVNLVNWLGNHYRHIKDFSIISTAPYTFDASLYDLFAALATAGNMHLTDEKYQLLPQNLVKIINQHQIKCGVFTPDGLKNLDPHCALKHIVTMGASPHEPSLQLWLEADPERRLENGYGPTETTICGSQNYWQSGILPNLIGKPVDNLHFYILNPHSLQPCPIGALGELCISGPGVALGYLNNETLTNKKFITLNTNPLQLNQQPERLYRTGDYCSYVQEANGMINAYFQGRIDQQVKIFGIRIDISEIENSLSSLSKIKKIVIVPNETMTGLHAYVVPVDYSISESELLHALRDCLKTQTLLTPVAYPRNITLIKNIPTTINGKVDISRLPRLPAPVKLKNKESNFEEYLLNLWAEVLNIDWQKISREKSFEDNGGDSMRVIWLGNRLCQKGSPFIFPESKITPLLTIELSFQELYNALAPNSSLTHDEVIPAITPPQGSPTKPGSLKSAVSAPEIEDPVTLKKDATSFVRFQTG